jgi:hypothetical protein
MKISLALGRPQALSRQTAWGCFSSNLALPGAGSLAAGRLSGYAQLALAVVGMILTVVFGLRFFAWYFANWSHLNETQDPLEAFGALWFACRWALLGIVVFGFGWLWGLATGLHLVQMAKKSEPPPLKN